MDASRRKRKASRVQRLTPRQQEAQSWAVVAGAGDDADGAAAAFILAPQVVEAKDEEQEDELLSDQQQRKRQKVKKGKKRLGAGSRQRREHASEEEMLTIRAVGERDEDAEEAEGGASRCIFIASGFALQDELASADGEGGLSVDAAAASSLPTTIARIRLVPFKSAILSDAEINHALANDHTSPPSSSSSTSADSCDRQQLRATLGLFLSTEGDVVACAPFDSAFASRIAATGDDGSVQAPPVVPQEVIDAALYLLRHKPHLVGVQAAVVGAGPGSSSRERRVELRFLLRPSAFKGARHADELKREQPGEAFHAIRRLMAWAYPGTVNDLYEEERNKPSAGTAEAGKQGGGEESTFDPMDLYRELSRCSEEGKRRLARETRPVGDALRAEDLEIPGLVATLRSYQRKAVGWMTLRETAQRSDEEDQDGDDQSLIDEPNVDDEGEKKGKEKLDMTVDEVTPSSSKSAITTPLHPLWTEYQGTRLQREEGEDGVDTTTGVTFYFNQFTGKFTLARFPAPSDVSGGILADEMGLGKTVEVLALILANPRPPQAGVVAKTGPGAMLTGGDATEATAHEDPQPSGIRQTNGRLRKSKRNRKKRQHKEIESPTENTEEEDQVWCFCGDDDPDYAGVWVQCESCRRWQHSACVGYVPSGPKQTVTRKRRRTSKNTTPKKRNTKGKRRTSKKKKKGESSEDEYREEEGEEEEEAEDDRSKQEVTEVLTGDSYECPECTARGGQQLESRATLIVCPDSILTQWQQEIERHTRPGALKYLVYEGVRGTVSKHAGGLPIVRPAQLVDYDVVLTTYTTLRNDLSHVISQSPSRNFRDKKRYRPIPTPLLGVRFWRTCLDEVQMIETPSTKVAKMALRLSTVNRWGVSGTPIQRRGLEDLHGLIAFLQLAPFDARSVWRQCVQLPYERGEMRDKLHGFLRTIMWRTSKVDVVDEIDIPPLHEKTRFLTFSPVEAHFYKKRLGDTVQRTRTIFERLKHNRAINFEKNVSKIFGSLLSLRQACCHPQVGSKSGLTSLQKNTMSMSELLLQLIIRATIECADGQRNLVASLNGLAGVALVNGDKLQAIRNYRQVLGMEFRPIDEEGRKQLPASVNEAEIISVDALQRLHALANLAEVFQGMADDERAELEKTEGHTLNDHRLVEEAAKLRELYAKRAELEQLVAQDKWKEATRKIKEAEDATITHNGESRVKPEIITGEDTVEREVRLNAWWVEALNLIDSADDNHNCDFVTKLRNELLAQEERTQGKMRGRGGRALTLAHRFQTVATLKHLLFNELKELAKKRAAAVNALLHLGDRTPTAADVELSGNCRQCRSYFNKTGQVCDHCKAHVLLMNYDGSLYRYRQKAPGEDGDGDDGDGAKKAHSKNKKGKTPAQGEDGEASETVGFGSFRESSEAEQVLAHIVRHLRSSSGSSKSDEERKQLLEEGADHIKRLQLMKHELKLSHEVWTKQKERLSALDELEMATVRIRLRVPGEIVPPEEEVVKLWPVQVEEVKRRLEVMKKESESELQRARGQLRYLKTLAQNKAKVDREEGEHQQPPIDGSAVDTTKGKEKLEADASEGDGVEEEVKECVICQETLKNDSDVAILLCGHEFCCPCIMTMVDRALHGTIKCPTCRSRMNTTELTFFSSSATTTTAPPTVLTSSHVIGDGHDDDAAEEARARALQEAEETAQERRVEVKGSWGTKIEGVVRCILHVQQSAQAQEREREKGKEKADADAGAMDDELLLQNITRVDNNSRIKCLVFSQWDDVLLLVSRALSENGVNNIRLRTANKKILQRDLDNFKSRSDVPVLLLPIRTGCNGLNLIEATHVFIVEPSLNLGAEAQAVGRVHRIGQSKQTFVYRFFIQSTVESKIYEHVYQKPKDRPQVTSAPTESSSSSGGSIEKSHTDAMEVEDHDAATPTAAAAVVVTKQNQAAEADSVDALWEENMSHFHRTKKGRECDMSLAELGELLGIDQADQAAAAAVDTGGAQPVSATGGGGEELEGQQAAANEAYWAEAVEYHRRTMRRDDALREIERVASWERRWKHHQRKRQLQQDDQKEEASKKEHEEAKDDREGGDNEQEAECRVERYGRMMAPQVWRQLDALRPQQP